MLARPDAAGLALDSLLAAQNKGLLRFITCGSVDDGKSTLIGRLLYETKLLYEDQLAALEADSRKFGTQGGGLDFALLTDGLAAEREQGITIDVAYRFFTTERRKFIVADTPGHEQYTRNMATGASTADLAVILIDARKGPTAQTRRHSLIVSMLGVRHVVVAVNKMDLVGWSEPVFRRIAAAYGAFAAPLGFRDVLCIPMAALTGDNIVTRSPHAAWYRGPTLLDHLETVEVDAGAANRPFRMPVQWVNRPDPSFRGYAGLIAQGAVRPGAKVRVMPSGRETRVERIVTFDRDLDDAAGRSVTLTFTDDIDVSRGDVVSDAMQPARVSDRLLARVLWTGEDALVPGRSYFVKLGTRTAIATIAALRHKIDLADLRPIPAERLAANEIGAAMLALDRPVAFDRYSECRDTGSFILIDRESCDTVGMGLIEDEAPSLQAGSSPGRVPADARAGEGAGRRQLFGRAGERPWRSLLKAVSWRATGSLDTTLLAFLFTGNLKVSAAIGVTEIGTKIALYYGHERIWARIPFGKAARADVEARPARPG